MEFDKLKTPKEGQRIEIVGNRLQIPDHPIIPIIEGDGVGPDVTRAARKVISEAVERAYAGKRRITWFEVFAGERAQEIYGSLLPEDTLKAIRHFVVALKGPITTPVGGGFRSLNVTLRQELDLYANVRPVYWITGVPSPMKNPEKVNVVIFREATEDVYAGIEWPRGSEKAKKLISLLRREFNATIREDSGIGIKPISEFCSKRLVRKAIRHAIENGRQSVTLMHKGNIMKFTEGAFRDWGYQVAREEFPDRTITEQELLEGKAEGAKGKIVMKDRIADNMFQQLLTRTEEYDVIATTNLNGDYISDAAAGQVGGLGVAPGANIGDFTALFEPIHGSAPKYAGLDKVNPTAEILAGVMMLEYLGWVEAARLAREAIKRTIAEKYVTYDLARQMVDAKEVRTSQFAQRVADNMRLAET